MKDINLEDLPDPSQLTVQDLPTPDQLSVVPKQKPGMIEAAARGLEQGATLGYGDELNAALETLLNQTTGQSPGLGLLDEYRKQREESRQKFAEAEAAHPYVSGAANIAGALAPALLTGGGSLAEQGLAGLAEQGAKYGAVAGLGGSTADLTKGQVGQAAKDVALGGIVGGITAPVAKEVTDIITPSAAKLASKLGKIPGMVADIGPISKLQSAFTQGLQGRELVTQAGQKALGKEITGTTDQLGTDLQSVFSDAAKKKLDTLVAEGPKVDISDWATDADSLMNNLNKTRGQDSRVRDDIAKIKDIINNHIYGVEDEANPGMSVPGKGLIVDTQQAETLLRQLGELGSASETSGLKTNEGKELINRLISPLTREPNLIDLNMGVPKDYTSLGELVTQSRPELSDQNTLLSNLAQAKEMLPNVRDISNLEKTSISGATSTDQINKFLEKLPPNLQDKYRQKLNDLAKAQSVSEAITHTGGLAKGLVEKAASKMGYGGANWAGIGARAIYDMTPGMLRNYGNKIASNADPVYQSLGRILNQAADKDDIGRNALFFALQQNPQYRHILRETAGENQEPTSFGTQPGKSTDELKLPNR